MRLQCRVGKRTGAEQPIVLVIRRQPSVRLQQQRQHSRSIRRGNRATVNATFINGQGLKFPGGWHWMAIITCSSPTTARTWRIQRHHRGLGTINAAFISGPQLGIPVDAALDGQNHMFVTNGPGGMIGEYNATTGARRSARLSWPALTSRLGTAWTPSAIFSSPKSPTSSPSATLSQAPSSIPTSSPA